MSLLTLFARKEPTRDAVSIAHGPANRMDTVLYRDALCTERVAVFGWFLSSCPRRGQKEVIFNCWRWKLEWVPAPFKGGVCLT